ncbi:MAG: peptidoglycan recognition family protein [Candidatus Paceibacterota bacterium]
MKTFRILFSLFIFFIFLNCVRAEEDKKLNTSQVVLVVASEPISFVKKGDTSSAEYFSVHHTKVFGYDGHDQLPGVDNYHKEINFSRSELGHNAGYNFFIDWDGTLTQTRKIGEKTCAQLHHNWTNKNDSDTITVCLAGDFNLQLPNEKQKLTLIELIKAIKKDYPKVKIILAKELSGDRNCPGDKFTRDYLEKQILKGI